MKNRLVKKKLSKNCMFGIWYEHVVDWFIAEISQPSPTEPYQNAAVSLCQRFGGFASNECYRIAKNLNIREKQMERFYPHTKLYKRYIGLI